MLVFVTCISSCFKLEVFQRAVPNFFRREQANCDISKPPLRWPNAKWSAFASMGLGFRVEHSKQECDKSISADLGLCGQSRPSPTFLISMRCT